MFALPRLLIGALVVAVVAVAAAGAGWWFFVREDAQLATNAPAVPTDIAGTPAGGGALAYTIIPSRSEAAYFADEQLASLPVPSTAKGTTTDIRGAFYLGPDGISLDPAKASVFTVGLTSLRSDRDMRDRRVQGTLETSRFPTATFTATGVTGYNASLPADAEQSLKLSGTLDLHGVQQQVTWDVKARKQGNVITALATLTFPFAQFNLTPPNIAGFVSVQDRVTLQVQIVAQAA